MLKNYPANYNSYYQVRENYDKENCGDFLTDNPYRKTHALSTSLAEMATRKLKGVDNAETKLLNGCKSDKNYINGNTNGYKNGFKKPYTNGHIEVSS